MAILHSQRPLDALVGQAQLLGQLRLVSFRGPALAVATGAGSFQAQLLEQMLGACDRTSLAMNEAEGQALPMSSPWVGLGPIGPQGLGEARVARSEVQRNPSAPPTNHPHLAAHHAHRTHRSSRPSAPTQATASVVVPLSDPGAAPLQPLGAKAVTHLPSAAAPGAADGFLEKLGGLARTTAGALGLSPHLLLAQAALETGWGRKAIKDGAGQESFNLFGIKASKHWTGKTVEVMTTECINGVPQKKMESFRAYDSYAESFSDYARLIKHRYGEAMAQGATAEGFGRALQAKGYATDPNYAQKIARVAQSVAYRLSSPPLAGREVG